MGRPKGKKQKKKVASLYASLTKSKGKRFNTDVKFKIAQEAIAVQGFSVKISITKRRRRSVSTPSIQPMSAAQVRICLSFVISYCYFSCIQ